MQRSVHVGRGRRSGVIVGTRPMVPASVVPEELISQVFFLNLLSEIIINGLLYDVICLKYQYEDN